MNVFILVVWFYLADGTVQQRPLREYVSQGECERMRLALHNRSRYEQRPPEIAEVLFSCERGYDI